MARTRDDRVRSLLGEIDSRGPISVRELLDGDRCESELHGMCAELRAAGLLEECEVAGERGYHTTDRANKVLSRLRG